MSTDEPKSSQPAREETRSVELPPADTGEPRGPHERVKPSVGPNTDGADHSAQIAHTGDVVKPNPANVDNPESPE